jgi:hypothetical protein
VRNFCLQCLAPFGRMKHVQLLACGVVIAFHALLLAGCDYPGRISTISRPAQSDSKRSSAGDSARRLSLAPPAAKPDLTAERSVSIPLSPVRDRELLNPPAAPDCEFKTSDDPKADERQKLDYERQCYRHAEMIVRSRLHLLQASVADRQGRQPLGAER